MSEVSEKIINLWKNNYMIAKELVARLKTYSLRIATVESVTAGYVTGFIASVPQASQCLRGGIVTYDTWSKAQFLGFSEEIIRETDGVSPEISELMAERARKKFDAHIGVSTTGFAGPTGREIGLAYIGISTLKENRVSQKDLQDRFLPHQREEIRLHVSLEALLLALNAIDSMRKHS
jgi:PncC family amidohydrolase